MMKDKKMTYLLICCVAVVWALIFYRVFAGMAADEPDMPIIRNPKTAYFNRIDHAGDTVLLDLSYSDPFSKPSIETSTEPVMAEAVTALNPQATPVKIKPDWSGITYSGQLYNGVQRRHVAIINVKGREVMLSEGERGEGLKFIRRVGDSIKVEYQGVSRFLSIK